MRKESDEDRLKQQVSGLVFEIKKQVQKEAYWPAAQAAHELQELLESQVSPYFWAKNVKNANNPS